VRAPGGTRRGKRFGRQRRRFPRIPRLTVTALAASLSLFAVEAANAAAVTGPDPNPFLQLGPVAVTARDPTPPSSRLRRDRANRARHRARPRRDRANRTRHRARPRHGQHRAGPAGRRDPDRNRTRRPPW
jgi:hypothetical protein